MRRDDAAISRLHVEKELMDANQRDASGQTPLMWARAVRWRMCRDNLAKNAVRRHKHFSTARREGAYGRETTRCKRPDANPCGRERRKLSEGHDRIKNSECTIENLETLKFHETLKRTYMLPDANYIIRRIQNIIAKKGRDIRRSTKTCEQTSTKHNYN